MKQFFRQSVSLFLIIILCSTYFSVLAANKQDEAEKEYTQKASFSQWAGSLIQSIGGYSFGTACPNSDDSYHHASTSLGHATGIFGGESPYYRCICDYCGDEFTAYASDLQRSYENQVEEMKSTYNTVNINQNGLSDTIIGGWTYPPYSSYESYVVLENSRSDFPFVSYVVSKSSSSGSYRANFSSGYFQVPTSGTYTFRFPSFQTNGTFGKSYTDRLQSFVLYLYFSLDGGETWSSDEILRSGFNSDSDTTFSRSLSSIALYYIRVDRAFNFPLYYSGSSYYCRATDYVTLQGVQAFPSGNSIYNINSRPTSVTGNYGIIGDNGQITQITDNSSIVNETTNQFFNPATGESATISDWSYNYEDRSYTVTTETGDTVTVTYGDENITIVQGGDTYNIYYMVPGGSGTPGPDSCAHNWQETDKTEPTCVTAGKTVSTCALCGKTKTDPLPATGHTWVVERTVQTSYDDEGNLLQQGYTIYQCSVCGEQYKDTQSTGPPGGTEEDKSLWEQLGDLIGSGIGGILELAGAILGKILDALTSLVEMITDKLKGIVEGILAIFDELPALFGGFLDFLGALFPYLPEEIMTLLTFGVIAIVFIGILKAVRR